MNAETFRMASFDNRKKQLSLSYRSGKTVTLHYGSLGIKDNIEHVWVDQETRGKSIGIRFSNAHVDYLPYDQPLSLIQDPEYLLQNQIELLIAKVKDILKKKKISKSYLAERLGTSLNQVNRLLNPKILNKNLPQLYQISSLLGMRLELHLKAA